MQRVPRHVYEEVTFNSRYLAHKLHITSGSHTPSSSGLANPQSLNEAEAVAYSYAVCGASPVAKAGNTLSSCTETDTYELMKPSGSVKTHTAIATAENICYTLDDH